MSNRLKTIELFLALGLATTVGSQALPTNAQDTKSLTEASLLMAQGAEGGEGHSGTSHGGETGGESGGESGGEGGEGATSGNPEVDYMTTLGLMKGHLMAAEELIAVKNYAEAEPHIAHPVDELYSQIETVLPQKGVEDFKPTLNQLRDLATSAPESPEMKTLFEQSVSSIDAAIAAVPEDQRNSPEFVMDVIVEMLKTAATEYEAAIADNKFVEVVEYQDSRGFVLYSEELYNSIAEQKSQADPEGHQTIIDSMTALKTAWPSIDPPATPIKTPSEVYSLVSQIEFNK